MKEGVGFVAFWVVCGSVWPALGPQASSVVGLLHYMNGAWPTLMVGRVSWPPKQALFLNFNLSLQAGFSLSEFPIIHE